MTAAIVVALAAGWATSVYALARLIASQARQHARERDLLTNQLLHAVNKPWAPAPAHESAPETVPRNWTASPEQLPIDD